MKILAADVPVYKECAPLDLMQHWLTNRPAVRLVEPFAQGAEIQQLYSCVDVDRLKHVKLFKCAKASDFKHTLPLITRTGQCGAGYFSSDVCRSLTFAMGFGVPVKPGDRGYMYAVEHPYGQEEIPDDAGLMVNGKRGFNNDFMYAGAHVLAYMLIKITKVGR